MKKLLISLLLVGLLGCQRQQELVIGESIYKGYILVSEFEGYQVYRVNLNEVPSVPEVHYNRYEVYRDDQEVIFSYMNYNLGFYFVYEEEEYSPLEMYRDFPERVRRELNKESDFPVHIWSENPDGPQKQPIQTDEGWEYSTIVNG
ncbi:hypothetical protein RI065_05640 [Mycoplasmatota bacterium zrk1]